MESLILEESLQIIRLHPISLMWIPYGSPIKCVEGTYDSAANIFHFKASFLFSY